jgi:hypothetical protein
VQLFLRSTHPPGAPADETAIFGIPVNGSIRYYFNRESIVTVAGDAHVTPFSFRNAPHFVSFLNGRATVRDAQHETDAVLNHFYTHPNTAPFLCRRLIQRLTTSNPSPRYVAACSAAFRTGAHAGVTYSGRCGTTSQLCHNHLDPITPDPGTHHTSLQEKPGVTYSGRCGNASHRGLQPPLSPASLTLAPT